MKLFGREPILITTLVTAVLALVATFGLDWLSAGQAGAISGVVIAVVAVATTRPWAPGLFTAVVTAGVALVAEYGTSLPESQVAALNTVVLAAFALITRSQVNPQETPISKS